MTFPHADHLWQLVAARSASEQPTFFLPQFANRYRVGQLHDGDRQYKVATGRMRRSGLSLVEMLVAAAILLASVVLLSQLADVGTRHARQAESLANAQRICQNVLNEILSGAAPLEPLEDMPLLDEPGWSYSVAFEPLPLPLENPQLGILRVTVTEQSSSGPHLPVQFTLWRFVRIPARLESQSEYLQSQTWYLQSQSEYVQSQTGYLLSQR